MDKIDETIELLKKVKPHGYYALADEQTISQALALLESYKAEQPPAGEFTKALRGFSDAIRNLPQYIGTTICWKLDEACNHLDAQQKEIERLKDVRRGRIERLNIALDITNQHIIELNAENAKLKEAQKQYCDTINRMDVNAEQMDKNYGRMVLERNVLTADLLKHGDHTKECEIDHILPREKRKCTCGWDELKAKLETKGE